MDFFNYNMTQYSPAAQSLTLSEIDEYLKKDYEGHIFFKEGQFSNNYINIKTLVDNINYLQRKVDLVNLHPQLQTTIDSMAEVINKLSEENDDLQERIAILEMSLGEN